MSYWVDDPQLFLYAKGTGLDDVILRKCKKPVSSSSTSLVVPMKSNDFDYESNVKNYRLLIGDRFDWDETDYKRLVKYIYERRLLLNGQGLVISEIYKLDDANAVPIYIRSLDVLPLKHYIPNIRERPIPLRTVKYLEDVNGEAAKMEDDDSNLAKRVADLELKNMTLEGKVTESNADLATRTSELANSQYQVADLELKNKTLEGKVTDSDADIATLTSEMENSKYQVADLELKNTTLESKVTESNADLATWTSELANSQYQVADLELKNKTLEGKVTESNAEVVDLELKNKTLEGKVTESNAEVTDLELKIKILEGKVTKSNADLATRTSELANSQYQVADLELKNKTLEGKLTKLTADLENFKANNKEVWMNDFTNSDWVGIEEILSFRQWDIIILKQPGTFTVEESSTNVRARYWIRIQIGKIILEDFKAVNLEDLTPNKEKARFKKGNWHAIKSTNGKTYVYQENDVFT